MHLFFTVIGAALVVGGFFLEGVEKLLAFILATLWVVIGQLEELLNQRGK